MSLTPPLIIKGLASRNCLKKIKRVKKKEINKDHIEMLRFFLANISEDLIQDLKEILNLLIRKIVI